MKGIMTEKTPASAAAVIHPFTRQPVLVRRMMLMKTHHGLEAGQAVYDCSDGRLYLCKTRFIYKRGLTVDFGPALDPEVYKDVLAEVPPHDGE
jgi:hypothetical protein